MVVEVLLSVWASTTGIWRVGSGVIYGLGCEQQVRGSHLGVHMSIVSREEKECES